jgi:hypothetical protein
MQRHAAELERRGSCERSGWNSSAAPVNNGLSRTSSSPLATMAATTSRTIASGTRGCVTSTLITASCGRSSRGRGSHLHASRCGDNRDRLQHRRAGGRHKAHAQRNPRGKIGHDRVGDRALELRVDLACGQRLAPAAKSR